LQWYERSEDKMLIRITAAQARRVAEQADQVGGVVALHQLGHEGNGGAGEDDLYVAPPDEESRWRISADGALVELDQSAESR
jgi:hypothetical protein